MQHKGTHDPMALLKLKRHAQITIPAELRRQFHLEEGDYLEAEVTEAGILLKPVAVIERDAAWDRVIGVMDSVQAKQPQSGQSPQAQEKEIADMIQASRRDHAERRP